MADVSFVLRAISRLLPKAALSPWSLAAICPLLNCIRGATRRQHHCIGLFGGVGPVPWWSSVRTRSDPPA